MKVMSKEQGKATAKWFSKGMRYQCAHPGCGFETNGPKAFGNHHAEKPGHRTPEQQQKYSDNSRQRLLKQQNSEKSEIKKFKEIMQPRKVSKVRKAHGKEVARSRNPVIEDMDYMENVPTKRSYKKRSYKGRSLRNSSNNSSNHKFCTHCGGPRTGSWTYCAHCGRKMV